MITHRCVAFRWSVVAVLAAGAVLGQAVAQTGPGTQPQSQPASQPQAAPLSPLRYFLPAQREAERSFEREINSAVDPARLRAWHDMLASEPHIAGSEGDAHVIQRMAAAFKDMGLEVQVHEFWPYLCKPVDAKLEILTPQPMILPLKEAALEQDPISQRSDLTFGFNAYSGSGDVTGNVVY